MEIKKIDIAPNYSIEAECSILCAILIDNNKMDVCVEEGLNPKHFGSVDLAKIYAVFLALFTKNTEIDYITTTNELVKSKKMDESTAIAKMTSLMDYVPFPPPDSSIKKYIHILKEYYTRRKYIRAAGVLSEIAEVEDLDKVNNYVYNTFIASDDDDKKIMDMEDINNIDTNISETFAHGVKVQTGAIWGAVGATSAGKTELALDVSYAYADYEKNQSVLFCEYEGTKKDLAIRIKRKGGEWAKKPIYATVKPSFMEITNFIKKHKDDKVLIVIDYLQRLARQLQAKDENARRGDIRMYVNNVYEYFDELRQKYNNISVCFLGSMSKDGIRETTTQKRISTSTILNAIKESGDVQYDLDYAYAILFTDEKNKENVSLGRFMPGDGGKARRYMLLRPIKEARVGEKTKEKMYTFNTDKKRYEQVGEVGEDKEENINIIKNIPF